MPQYYKAKTDHRPIDYSKDLNSIARFFRGSGDDFLSIYHRWKLRPPENDDLGQLIQQVTRRLIDFALVCDAVPQRTPRQLIATVKLIAKNPAEFLDNVGKYDPEVVARVFEAFTKGSAENRFILSQFEAGLGPPPPAEAIAHAASNVLDDLTKQLEEESGVGGQTLVLQRELIQDLAAIFVKFGGSLKRSTQFNIDLPAHYSYQGPFHDFLKLVLVPARQFARMAGFKMESIRSLVNIPKKDNPDGSKTLPSLFGEQDVRRAEWDPVRRGNFFKLHEHRLRKKIEPN